MGRDVEAREKAFELNRVTRFPYKDPPSPVISKGKTPSTFSEKRCFRLERYEENRRNFFFSFFEFIVFKDV